MLVGAIAPCLRSWLLWARGHTHTGFMSRIHPITWVRSKKKQPWLHGDSISYCSLAGKCVQPWLLFSNKVSVTIIQFCSNWSCLKKPGAWAWTGNLPMSAWNSNTAVVKVLHLWLLWSKELIKSERGRLKFHFSKIWDWIQIWDVWFAIKRESGNNDVCNVCLCMCTAQGGVS